MKLVLALIFAVALPEDGPEARPPVEDEALVAPTLVEAPALPWPGGPPYEAVEVQLLLLIDEAGRVEEATLLAGPPPFGELALARAPALRFTPARAAGEALAVEMPFTWRFEPPPVQVEGRVLDAAGQPIAGLAMGLGERRFTTDADGAFALRELPEGEWALAPVEPVEGLAPVIVAVRPGERVEAVLTVALPSAGEALGTWRARPEGVVLRTMSAEEIRTTPGTLGDPVRAVQNLPGVVRTPFDAGWLIVRGGAPRDTGTFIDGVRVPLVFHLGGFTSVLHPAMVERVDFMPGAFDVRYGRSTAGVVDLVTRPAGGERRVELGADLIHAGAFVQTPLGEGRGLSMAARRSYLDQVLTVALSEEQAQIAPRFLDWQARYDGRRAGLFWLGYRDALVAPTGDGDKTAEVSIATWRLHGRLALEGRPGTLTLTPTFAMDERGLDYDGLVDRREGQSLGLRVEWAPPPAGPARLLLGLDAESWRYSIAVDEVEAEALILSPDPYARLALEGRGQLTLGLRLETWRPEGQLWRVSPSPRVSATWPLRPGLALVGDAGVFHQPPPFEWLVGLPVGRYLAPERSLGQGLGLRWDQEHVSLTLDGWWRLGQDLMRFEDDGTPGQGQGLAWGVEALTRWQAGAWQGWVSGTWSRSLEREEPGQLYRPTLYDQPLYGVAVAAWSFGRGWSLSGRARAGSGYAWDGVTDEAYDLLTLSPFPLVPDERQRLRPFYALDVKLARSLQTPRWSMELYLDVQNLTNRRVEEPIITGIDDRETVYGRGLPVLPVLGLRGAWRGAAGSPEG